MRGLHSVSTKAVILVIVVIVVNISVCTAFTLNHFAGILGHDRMAQNLTAAEQIVNPRHEPYAIENGVLTVGGRALNGDASSVDAVVASFGGVATIFQGDMRVATNIKKADGTRAVGTRLARGPVYDAVLGQGRRYIGEATILDRPYVAAYEPIKDASGQTIGILFVGVDKNTFNAMFDQAVKIVCIAGLILALVSVAVGGALFHRLFAPFKSLCEHLDDAKAGRRARHVPYTDRGDEFGVLARAILDFDRALDKQDEMRQAAEAEKIRAAEERKRAEEEARTKGQTLVVSTFGEGLKALANEDLSYRLHAELPAAYRVLQDDFNAAVATFERHRIEREEAQARHDADRHAAHAAQKKAMEDAEAQAMTLVVSSFGEGMKALSERDLTHRVDRELPAGYRGLQQDFNAAMDTLTEAVRDIDMRAADIASTAKEISAASQEMAGRTEQQAASLEQTSAAMEEITATVAKSAENAKQANDTAASAKVNAEHGNGVAKQTVEAMRAIATSSSEITQIIGVMDEIAFQTNLLALNAGVEAARAGEAGKGFAVVATEVRTLAGRSAEAAKKIRALITTSESQVDTGVKLVETCGTALEQIVADVVRINGLISEIAGAQTEQATALGEVNAAVAHMDQTTQQNAAMAEQSTAASKTMADHAGELAELIDKFRTVRKAETRRIA
jgi:methyl-accepting chemotaxis protein